jgi:hypothetical protein
MKNLKKILFANCLIINVTEQTAPAVFGAVTGGTEIARSLYAVL